MHVAHRLQCAEQDCHPQVLHQRYALLSTPISHYIISTSASVLSCCVFNNMLHRDQATHLHVQGRMDREFLSPRMPEQAAGWTILLRKHVVAILLPGFRVYERQKWSVLHWKRTKRPNLLSDGTLHEQTEGRATLYYERGHVIDWMQDWWCVCVVQRVDLFTAHARMCDTIFARNNCNHTVM